MKRKLQVDIVTDGNRLDGVAGEWSELLQREGIRSPFCSFAWFASWYQCYCSAQDIRLLLFRDAGELIAILPGWATCLRRGGMELNCLRAAGIEQFPAPGIIAGGGDLVRIGAALATVAGRELGVDLVLLPDLEADGVAAGTIGAITTGRFGCYLENSYLAPRYAMPDGWDAYLAGRSKKFRKRLRESQVRAERIGEVEFQHCILALQPRSVQRLAALDARTWQGQLQRGVIRCLADQLFLGRLALNQAPLFASYLRIGRQDAAFVLGVRDGATAYFLKTGFDPRFADCRPGVLVRARASEELAGQGTRCIDLGAEEYEEKQRWTNGARSCSSYWLVNRGRPKGALLWAELNVYHGMKRCFPGFVSGWRSRLNGREADVPVLHPDAGQGAGDESVGYL